MNTKTFRITQDGKMFEGNECIGFVEDNEVWVYLNDEAVIIGTYDHKREVFEIVQAYRERK